LRLIMSAFISRHSLMWVLMLILAWVFVFTLRSVPIAGNWQPLGTDTLAFIASCLAAALAGGILATLPSMGAVISTEKSRGPDTIESAMLLLAFASLAGALVVILEFAVRRGYGFTTPVEIIRVMEVNRALKGSVPSAFSGAGRLAAGAIAAAWVLYFVAQTKLRTRTFVLMSISTIVGFILEARFMGGRLFIAGAWTAAFFAAVAGYTTGLRSGRTLSVRPFFGLILAGALIAGYFVFVFVERIAARGSDAQTVYEQYSEHFGGGLEVGKSETPIEKTPSVTTAGPVTTQPVSEPSPQTPAEAQDAEQAVVAKPSRLQTAFNFLWVYATQGLNELDRLLQIDGIKLAHGGIQFGKVAQILTVLTGRNLTYDMAANLPNPGLYWTMLGDTYVDFGYYGSMLAAAVFGFLLTYSARLAFAGRLGPLAMSFPFLMSLAMFSPMLSLVQNLWPSIFWLFVAWVMVRGWQIWGWKA
jgi:hypothetical protein